MWTSEDMCQQMLMYRAASSVVMSLDYITIRLCIVLSANRQTCSLQICSPQAFHPQRRHQRDTILCILKGLSAILYQELWLRTADVSRIDKPTFHEYAGAEYHCGISMSLYAHHDSISVWNMTQECLKESNTILQGYFRLKIYASGIMCHDPENTYTTNMLKSNKLALSTIYDQEDRQRLFLVPLPHKPKYELIDPSVPGMVRYMVEFDIHPSSELAQLSFEDENIRTILRDLREYTTVLLN